MRSYMLVQLCVDEKVNNAVKACKQMLANLDPSHPHFDWILDFIIYMYI